MYRIIMEKRMQQVTSFIEQLEERIAAAPDGKLILCKERGNQRYYCKDPVTQHRRYLGNHEADLIRQLAQKDYDLRVLSELKRERSNIHRLLNGSNQQQVDDCYRELSPARKEFVEPIALPEEDFRKQWEAHEFSPLPINQQAAFLTEKGNYVRSKSEVIIANALFSADIPYRYECPIHIRDLGIVHPDFTALNVHTRTEYYWEHFGMMDDANYCEKAIRKLAAYEASGLILGKNLIITMESNRSPLDTRTIRSKIGAFLR